MNYRPMLLGAAFALALAACQTTADTDPTVEPNVGTDGVEMHNNAFDPAVVEIPAGTTIAWRFSDNGRPHNVVGDGFQSDVSSAGTFTHTFAAPGTYDYTCTLHSGMDGRVIVTDP